MKNLQRGFNASERPLVQHDEDEPDITPENEMWLARIARPLLAVFGLCYHLLIFWLLFFPYIYFRYGICDVNCTIVTTGWQALGFVLIFPIIPYLMYLLSLLWKSMLERGSLGDSFSDLRYLLSLLWERVQIAKWLETSLKINIWINLVGFLTFYGALLSHIAAADHDTVAWTDAAYGFHLTLILLAVVASTVISVVLCSWLQRSANSVDPFR